MRRWLYFCLFISAGYDTAVPAATLSGHAAGDGGGGGGEGQRNVYTGVVTNVTRLD